MIRFIKIFLLFIFLCTFSGYAQSDIFDCEKSRDFAKYLYNSNQYELAKHELERLNYFCKIDSASQLFLLKSSRKLSLFDDVNLFYLGKSVQDLNGLSNEFKLEYVRGLMAQKEYQYVRSTINEGFTFDQKIEHQIGTSLLLQNWNEAYKISQQDDIPINYKIAGLKKIAEESYLTKRKKPWLSTLMSAVIPGSGKMYCGYWGDGVISFLFTATSSYFAYRAFNKYGADKVYPWIAGGLAVSYYAGNVYGGNRAAIHYNEHLNHEFIHETEHILYSDY